MIKEKTGLVKDVFIREAINRKYGVPMSDIVLIARSRANEVNYQFELKGTDKYCTKQTCTLEHEEVQEIVENLLKEDGIVAKDIQLEFEHIEGDSFEPMDYGTFKFVGFKFTIV